ncbi:MAG: serine hydrolase [Clostridia bacterium]|nr:serine hydrolase [Clostridia bacterium]
MNIAEFGRWVTPQLERLGGDTGVYVKNLVTGEMWARGEGVPVCAASVIKIPVMMTVLRLAEEGKLSLEEVHALKDEERLPSCGTLKAMHTGIEMTLLDLVKLMIIVSDNAATNILIRRTGIEAVNDTLRQYGCRKTTLRRLLFDAQASRRGIQNDITAGEMGMLLEKMYKGELISPRASGLMLDILLDQRLNGKLPFFVDCQGIEVAHKTGEDDGISHDVGILYAEEPIVCCFVGEHVDVPAYERLMQDSARMLCITE